MRKLPPSSSTSSSSSSAATHPRSAAAAASPPVAPSASASASRPARPPSPWGSAAAAAPGWSVRAHRQSPSSSPDPDPFPAVPVIRATSPPIPRGLDPPLVVLLTVHVGPSQHGDLDGVVVREPLYGLRALGVVHVKEAVSLGLSQLVVDYVNVVHGPEALLN